MLVPWLITESILLSVLGLISVVEVTLILAQSLNGILVISNDGTRESHPR